MRWWFLVLAACTSPPATSVDVHVHDLAGAPIGGAVVAVTCTDGTSGAGVTSVAVARTAGATLVGVAHVELYDQVDLATCLVTASHAGFDPAQVTASETVDVTLEPPP